MVKTPLYPVYPFLFTRVLRVVDWNGTGLVYVQIFCTPREILSKNTHLKKSRTACTFFAEFLRPIILFRKISGTEYTFQVIHPPWPIAVKKNCHRHLPVSLIFELCVLSRYLSPVVEICYMLNVCVLPRYLSPVVEICYMINDCVCCLVISAQ